MKKRTLLIDGDVVAYQHAAKVEQPIHWGDDLWTLHADARECRGRIKDWIGWIKEKVECESIQLFLSCPQNFRKELEPSYKANRKNKRKPIVLQDIREWMMSEYGAVVYPRLEADDAIGLELTRKTKGERVAASIDKDFDTIPGMHFNWDKDETVREVTKEEADYNFFTQALTGDSTDNYGGCPGVGPKKAEKILEGVSDYWGAIRGAYEKAGLSEEVALTQARLARILRDGEYNMKTNKIKLWKPL